MASYTRQFLDAVDAKDMELARRLMVEHGYEIVTEPRVPSTDTDTRTTIKSVLLSVRTRKHQMYRVDHDHLDEVLTEASLRFVAFVQGEISFVEVERFAP